VKERFPRVEVNLLEMQSSCSRTTESRTGTPASLMVVVHRVAGRCPVYREGDGFRVLDGYRLVANQPVCLHALMSLAPYYVALSRGVAPEELGLAGPDGAAYVRCLDPAEVTGGGSVTFRVEVLGPEAARRDGDYEV